MSDLDLNLSGSLKVKLNVFALPLKNFLLVSSSNICSKGCFTRNKPTKLSDLEFDLSRCLKVESNVLALPLYDFLLVFNINV